MTDVVDTLTVELGERSYPIHLGAGMSDRLLVALAAEKAKNRRLALITDGNVEKALTAFLHEIFHGVPRHVVPPGENSKSLLRFGNACEFLAGQKVDRGGLLLALGGGVVGDLAGFIAATFLRGIEYWQVPTTLLAMVDSAVGGKTGINLHAGKNLVGAFHQPCAVFCDMALLETLPSRDFASGTAEVIKYGLLADAALFAELESTPIRLPSDARLAAIVRTCCAIKAAIVRDDERETSSAGGRALLNLGHTFAHAIEAVAGYGEYLHGEAVAIGLVGAAHLSERLGLVDAAVVARVQAVVGSHGLPVKLSSALPVHRVIDAMQRDKKVSHGRLKFVGLEAVGRAATREDVSPALVEEIWSELGAI